MRLTGRPHSVPRLQARTSRPSPRRSGVGRRGPALQPVIRPACGAESGDEAPLARRFPSVPPRVVLLAGAAWCAWRGGNVRRPKRRRGGGGRPSGARRRDCAYRGGGANLMGSASEQVTRAVCNPSAPSHPATSQAPSLVRVEGAWRGVRLSSPLPCKAAGVSAPGRRGRRHRSGALPCGFLLRCPARPPAFPRPVADTPCPSPFRETARGRRPA